MGIEIVVRLVALLLAALATGGLMVNWIGLARAMARLSSAAYTEFHQATNWTFDPYMRIVMSGASLGGVALAVVSPGVHSAPCWLAIFGAVSYAAIIALTLLTNLPTNKAIATWSVQAPPDDWRAVRASWIRWHIIRTLVSVPALACYLLSVLLDGR